MFKILTWAVVASILWLAISCDEFCEESTRTAVVLNFFSLENDVLTPASVGIRGIENDSALYPEASRSQALLPVNPNADFMSFILSNANDDLPADTIVIRYARHVGFISSECGCAAFAEIQDEIQATRHSIKDIIVTKRKVATVSYRQGVVNEENIRIYY